MFSSAHSCDYYAKHGKVLPDDWKEKIGGHDAICFGCRRPAQQVPDHISHLGARCCSSGAGVRSVRQPAPGTVTMPGGAPARSPTTEQVDARQQQPQAK